MNSSKWALLATFSCVVSAASAADLSYLQGLLDATPAGGWVKASSNLFSDAWPTDPDLPPPTPSGPQAVAYSWSGLAWDSKRGNLVLYGGGHANYVGNEVYVWQGADGAWTRGTLPSRVDLSTHLVVGNGAPQSAHTYQTNSYAPINDRFIAFGGASWNSGGHLADATGRTGPWWWDPSKSDPIKVGGADGTGWDPARSGSNSWQARPYDPWVGLDRMQGPGYVYGTSAYRSEAGRDVIYLTMDQNASGFPMLMRYELGDPDTPDTWSWVGNMDGGWSGTAFGGRGGSAAIDLQRGLFVRLATPAGGQYTADIAVFDLSRNNAANPYGNLAVGVQLVDAHGNEWNAFVGDTFENRGSLDYDIRNDQFVIWDGSDGGTVWVTRPQFDVDGKMETVWTVTELSTTGPQPVGLHADGVYGKWKYASELGAFLAMDAYRGTDAEIWLYKPLAAVPESGTFPLLFGGLTTVVWLVRRRERVGALCSRQS